jgi:GT2 family glycosyltransferase
MALVVPTLNRPSDLERCLASVEAETVAPAVVIVADASDDQTSRDVVRRWTEKGRCQYVYLPCVDRGSTVQRNRALEHVPSGVTYVGLTDDDIVFAPDYHDRVLNLMESGQFGVVAGAAGASRIPRRPVTRTRIGDLLRHLFLIRSMNPKGQLLCSGANVAPPDTGPPLKVGWLFGCAVYRADIARSIRFSEELRGYAVASDVDFSLRARRRGALVVDPEARVQHFHSRVGRRSEGALVRKTLFSRRWLVAEHAELGLRSPCFWWSVLGMVLIGSCSALMPARPAARESLAGTLAGLWDLLSHGRRQWRLP